ncbi:MAG: radical SAM protein [Elusimicrobiota bacterium]|jgi:organic radical activating enzyme|nr:radical SAM protein [Elusimicrobiota bacterium]
MRLQKTRPKIKEYILAVKEMRKNLSETGIKKNKQIKNLINLFLFKKIPYVEIAITTRCTLKCKDCANYIPDIDNDKHYSMTFEEYKTYLDNLLFDIKKLHKLVLLGGEPLLNRDLEKILRYSLEHPKVRKVKLVTNGTMDIPENIIMLIKRYSKPLFSKVRLFISDYSANKEISGKLKIKEIKAKLKSFGVPVSSTKNANWYPVSQIKNYGRSRKENIKNFLICPFQCVSLTLDSLFVCPRAAFFKMYDICFQQEGVEYLDLKKPVMQRDYFAFYSNIYFNACSYCNMIEDVKHSVMPAIQK